MGHNCHHRKDLQRINNVENIQKKESSYHLGGNVNGEATVKNGMEVPWNTKRRGIIWSCNLIPGLGFRKKCSFKMTRAPWYSGQHYYNSQDRIHQSVHWRKYEDCVVHYTLECDSAIKHNEMLILAVAWMNQETVILCEGSQRERQICDVCRWNI